MIVARIIAAIIGYICGMFTAGFFIAKAKHVDIKSKGSGNVGSTNVLRTVGPIYGVLTLICDCLKCVLAVFIVWAVFKDRFPEGIVILEFYGAIFAVFGHMFSAIVKFKGGKGIATGLGFIMMMYPKVLIFTICLFLLGVIISKYVSVGSILGALSLFFGAIIEYVLGISKFVGYELEACILAATMAVIVIIKHRENIKRLIKGEENKFLKSKPKN